MSNLATLRRYAADKRNPEFTDGMHGANLGLEFAHRMLAEGKLTQRELKDFEAYLWHDLLDKLPPERFSEMSEDGSLADLEALARGIDDDDDRDADGIDGDRKAVNRKVSRAALEGEWQGGRIDSQRYAQLHSDHIGRDRRVDRLLAAGEDALKADDFDRATQIFDEAASEVWALQHPDEVDHDADLDDYMGQKYRGEKPSARKRNPRSNMEAATDAMGVIDLDKLEKLEGAR